jgi:hypothetical protein
MARRKRKQTLFDVMNKGSGFTPPTYATRAPRPGSAYTPPKPKSSLSAVVADWLQEKLQARRAASAERAKLREATHSTPTAAPSRAPAPMRTARDELEVMRRELGAKPSPEPAAAIAITKLATPAKEPIEASPPRRSALDALAAMRAELATTVESETSSVATEVVDGVEEHPSDEPAPARRKTIITSIFRSKAKRPAMESIETPRAALSPEAAHEQQITITSTAGEELRARPTLAQRVAPVVAWMRRKAFASWSHVRSSGQALARRGTMWLDRLTTQNGHRIALGRYTPFIVGGAILFTVILAFVFGQIFRPRAPSALELAAREARDGVTRPDVINREGQPTGRANTPTEPAPVVIDGQPKSNVPAGNIAARQPAASLVKRWNGPQTMGENYVVVMSYTAEADAVATIEVLAKYGIGATVEMNIPRYHGEGQADRFYVVTNDGFSSKGTAGALINGVSVEKPYKELAKNPDYAALIAQVLKCSEAEFRKTLPAKLDPRPYKWDARPRR